MPFNEPFVAGPVSLRVQSILFNNDPGDVQHALESLARAAELAMRAGVISRAEVAYGDCSPKTVFTAAAISDMNQRYAARGIDRIDYRFFDANLGSAGGHNRLLEELGSDLVMIQNPDVIAAPNLISEMIRPLMQPGVGQVEARQIPIEHPKYYDPLTGETGWASTACAMVPRQLIEEVERFDAKTFFLYCDDVDLSWRIRLAGYRIVFQASACVFHDKRLTPDGHATVGAAEEYYSAEAALLLTHKYSRPDLAAKLGDSMLIGGTEAQRRAVAEYRRRARDGLLPAPLDTEHRIAEFVNHAYANHRF